jgi:hypothetical protein
MRAWVILIPALLSGCWNTSTPEEHRQAALRKLDAMESMTMGELIRARADCQAVAYEVPSALDDCLRALEIQMDVAQRTLDDIQKRRAELNR